MSLSQYGQTTNTYGGDKDQVLLEFFCHMKTALKYYHFLFHKQYCHGSKV